MSSTLDPPFPVIDDTFLDETPPSYTPSRPPAAAQLVTHSYSLSDKHGNKWLTLNVESKATSPDQLPVVIGDRPVHGNVVFDPKDHKHSEPKSITVKIIGELVSQQNMRFSFVEHSLELWSAPGDRNSPCVLPFTFKLPQTIETLSEDNTVKSFTLPHTDFARYSRFTLVYSLEVKVKYNSILRSSHLLETQNIYIPFLQPQSPSALRQDAYATRTPIPPPEVDRLGWHTLPPIVFEGTIFNDRTITIKYTLSLAKPLSYTRGSVVPLHLLVECSDTHGLDLASAPSAPVVRLRRISHNNYDAGGANTPGTRGKLSDLKPASMTAFHDLVDWLNTATWWSTPSDVEGTRTLQGEIHLRGSLKPSALLGLYKLSYDVALFEPKIPGFVSSHAQKDKVLQSLEVEVATVYADGPRPIAYSPPAYEEENANQPEETRKTVFNRFNKDMFL